MFWACGTYVGRDRCAQGVGGETRGKKDHWGDQDVVGRIILRYIFRRWDVGLCRGSIWAGIVTGSEQL